MEHHYVIQMCIGLLYKLLALYLFHLCTAPVIIIFLFCDLYFLTGFALDAVSLYYTLCDHQQYIFFSKLIINNYLQIVVPWLLAQIIRYSHILICHAILLVALHFSHF